MSNKPEATDPRTLLPLQAADFQVLLILANGPLHPYGLSKAVEGQPGGHVRLEIGSLYRMLNRMMATRLIEEADGASAEAQGPAARRRVFRITKFGRRVARAEARRLEAVLDAAREQKFLPQARGN